MSKKLTTLQQLKKDFNGKRFYVACRCYSTGANHVVAHFKPVAATAEDTIDAAAESYKYFKAQHRGTYEAPNTFGIALCSVGRFGNLSWGCFEEVKVLLPKEAPATAPAEPSYRPHIVLEKVYTHVEGGPLSLVRYTSPNNGQILATLTPTSFLKPSETEALNDFIAWVNRNQ